MNSKNNSKDSEHQKDLERLKLLRPIDDDFMRCLFRDNKKLAQTVLRIILNKDDLIVETIKTQADMKRLVGARSICLDVYATDSTGKKYDIEVQRADEGAHEKRARYHSSVMDVENLNANEDFKNLPDTYTIFITQNDLFSENKPIYRIERVHIDRKNSPLFNDGEHIIYVNGEYRGQDDIGNLMHDFSCSNPYEMYNSDLKKSAIKYKEQEGIPYMCEILEQMRAESKEEGIEEGIEIGREEGIEIGREEGIEEGSINTCIKMSINFGFKEDAEILRLQKIFLIYQKRKLLNT